MAETNRAQVAALLRQVIGGEVPYAVEESGNAWVVEAAGWTVLIFDDAGQADYVEVATDPTGRVTDFDDYWAAHGGDPIDLLTEDEVNRLSALLSECAEERRLVDKLRAAIPFARRDASRVGPQHVLWDTIFDAEAIIAGRETLLVGPRLDRLRSLYRQLERHTR